MRHSTLGRAYTELISSFSEAAQDHVNFADGLDAQVVNALKLVEKGHNEAKKKVHALNTTTLIGPNPGFPSQQVKAFQKLLSDRDRAYGDRIKVSDSTSRSSRISYTDHLVSLEQTNGTSSVSPARNRVANTPDLVRRRMSGS